MTRSWGNIFLLLLFTLPAALSFGEDMFSLTAGAGPFTEKFPEDHYSRYGGKSGFDITWHHYSEKFFLGLFTGISYEKTTDEPAKWEENEREKMKPRAYTGRDLRLFFGPSYNWKIEEEFFIPISLGPVVSFYFEEAEEHLLVENSYFKDTTYQYSAVSGGIKGDLALIWSLNSWFFLRGGASLEWIFLRGEASQMRMNYRTTDNEVLTWTRYSGIHPVLYVGAGIRMGS
jgi:hypothetical protein